MASYYTVVIALGQSCVHLLIKTSWPDRTLYTIYPCRPLLLGLSRLHDYPVGHDLVNWCSCTEDTAEDTVE